MIIWRLVLSKPCEIRKSKLTYSKFNMWKINSTQENWLYVYNTLTTFHYSNINGFYFLITNWFFSDAPVIPRLKLKDSLQKKTSNLAYIKKRVSSDFICNISTLFLYPKIVGIPYYLSDFIPVCNISTLFLHTKMVGVPYYRV